MLFFLVAVASCSRVGAAPLSFRRAGWLDRVVAYHKQNFFEDVQRVLPPVEIKASIQRAPTNYVEAEGWDFESVTRLLALLRASPGAAPVRRALRRALAPTRRLYIGSNRNSYRLFPSLTKDLEQNFYYDVGSEYYSLDDEDTAVSWTPRDDDVVVITNPVESRMPGGHISVGLIKEILANRALAARMMPSTVRSTLTWKTHDGKVTKPNPVTEPSTEASTAPASEGTTVHPSEGPTEHTSAGPPGPPTEETTTPAPA